MNPRNTCTKSFPSRMRFLWLSESYSTGLSARELSLLEFRVVCDSLLRSSRPSMAARPSVKIVATEGESSDPLSRLHGEYNPGLVGTTPFPHPSHGGYLSWLAYSSITRKHEVQPALSAAIIPVAFTSTRRDNIVPVVNCLPSLADVLRSSSSSVSQLAVLSSVRVFGRVKGSDVAYLPCGP